MRRMMKNALIFLFGMVYLYSLQIMASPNLGGKDALIALPCAFISVGGSIVILINIGLFFAIAWDEGDEKTM